MAVKCNECKPLYRPPFRPPIMRNAKSLIHASLLLVCVRSFHHFAPLVFHSVRVHIVCCAYALCVARAANFGRFGVCSWNTHTLFMGTVFLVPLIDIRFMFAFPMWRFQISGHQMLHIFCVIPLASDRYWNTFMCALRWHPPSAHEFRRVHNEWQLTTHTHIHKKCCARTKTGKRSDIFISLGYVLHDKLAYFFSCSISTVRLNFFCQIAGFWHSSLSLSVYMHADV